MPAQPPRLAGTLHRATPGTFCGPGCPLSKFLTASPPSRTLTSSGQLVLARQSPWERLGGGTTFCGPPGWPLSCPSWSPRSAFGRGTAVAVVQHILGDHQGTIRAGPLTSLNCLGAHAAGAGPGLVIRQAATRLPQTAQVLAQGRKPRLRETAAGGCAGRTRHGTTGARSVEDQGPSRHLRAGKGGAVADLDHDPFASRRQDASLVALDCCR
jgi:hypothetical protein